MKTKHITYNKLVRDKIPSIIEEANKKCKISILSEENYIIELENKLNEEVEEYQKERNLEEMADILEVLYAICVAKGYTVEELENLRKRKASEKGKFKDKIFLEYVESDQI